MVLAVVLLFVLPGGLATGRGGGGCGGAAEKVRLGGGASHGGQLVGGGAAAADDAAGGDGIEGVHVAAGNILRRRNGGFTLALCSLFL